MIRIYAVADIHSDPGRLEHIRTIVSARQPDVVVAAGDVINYFPAEKTLALLNNMRVPVLFVRGNSDPGYVEKYANRYLNITSLHLNRVTVQSTSFTGLSGTIPLPFYNRVGFFEKHLKDKAASLIDSNTVMVAHTPPRGTLDQVMGRFSSGSPMIRDLVAHTQPRLLICGHIHEAAGISAIGQTVVVNCSMPATGKGMMIELKEECEPEIEIL